MYWSEKHILACTAIHCMKKGSSTVAGRLRIELKRRGLEDRVMCNTCDSIEVCDMGPNMVVYPDGIIYAGVQVSDISDIINHLEGGPPVERLMLTPDRPDEVNRKHLFQSAVEHGESVPYSDFVNLSCEYDLDEAWINEQKQRGFIAIKEADGENVVSVTSKARIRYGLPVDSDSS